MAIADKLTRTPEAEHLGRLWRILGGGVERSRVLGETFEQPAGCSRAHNGADCRTRRSRHRGSLL